MAAIVGIDLGTTYSGVAHWDDLARPSMVMDPSGRSIVPSCVALIEGELRVGEEARKHYHLKETEGAARFKRDMEIGRPHEIAGEEFTPMHLSTLVLGHLKQYTEQRLGPIENAVVTLPANFNDLGRRSTMAAADAAGLPIKNIINEPTAAALYYACTGDIVDGLYAVYDFGGGTFDVSIVIVKEKSAEVIRSSGVKRLGGMDFDARLQQLLVKKYKEESGEALAKEYEKRYLNPGVVEEAKRSLSERSSVEVFCMGEVLEVTRQEFEKAVEDLVVQAQICCEGLLDEEGMDPKHLKGVLLAGGTTRVPCVRDSIRRVFGCEPIARANVDEVVALGACLYAGHKADKTVLTAIQALEAARIEFQEVSTKYFGTDAVEPTPYGEVELRNSILIEAGTKLPCQVTQHYMTHFEGQDAVSCMMTESDRAETDLDMVTKLQEGMLKLPPGRPAGQEIRVTFRYDENQVLHGYFQDIDTGESITLRHDMVRG